MSRLGMNCSELKYHLYIHVAETPNCLCGCIETPQHYFFECPLYLTHRDILLVYFQNTEAPLTLKNIIYGDIKKNMTETLITSVEKYICETQRFSILCKCFSVFSLAMLYSHRCNIILHSVVQQMH